MESNEFINPKSMLTPGIVGTLIMFVSNSLWMYFAIPSNSSDRFLLIESVTQFWDQLRPPPLLPPKGNWYRAHY